ncbi:MAG: hypothetical protein KFF77_01715 [Bacteroidetes bacterium]|nr:hypothetical protein [Bacteroidota bacterium]
MERTGIINQLLRRLRFVVPMLLALGVLVLLRAPGEEVMFRLAGIRITQEALTTAGWTTIRLLAIATASMLFTLLVPLSHVVDGMRRVRIPHPVVSVTWMTERFLAILTSDLRRTMDGVRARSAALALPRRVLLGTRIAASFLLRAVARSEYLADAMTARGFDGRIPILPGARWMRRDSFIASACLVVFIVAIVL